MLRKTAVPKALFVKVMQWFYLILTLFSASIPFWYKNLPYLDSLALPNKVIYAVAGALVVYCLLLAFSFLTQNTTLLILSLVFIFFTTIGALILLVIALPNSQAVFSGHLPACAKNLANCNFKDGLIVGSAILLSISVPILVLNLLTIIGAVKAIAATD